MSRSPSGTEHGFLYSDGTYTTLDDPASTKNTNAGGINNLGQIVGYYWDSNPQIGNDQGFIQIQTTPPSPATITSVTDNVAPVTGLTNGGYTNDPDPTVQVSLSGTGALAGDTLQLYDGTDTGSPLGSAYTLTSTDISNGFAIVQPGTLTNGTTYTLTARITDAAGNQSAVSANSFTLTEETTAPSAPSITSVTDNVPPITGPLTNGGYTNDPDPTVQVSLSGTGALAGDTLQLYDGTDTGSPLGSAYTLTSTDISNGFAIVQPGTLTNGTTYTLTARITDAAGNQSAVSANSFTLTEETTAPSAPSITSVTDNVPPITGPLTNGGYTNDPDPTVQVSLSGTGALAGDTLQLYDGTDTSSPLGSAYTLTSTDISNGFAIVQPGTLTNGTTYTLTARITDAAGDQSAVSTNSFTLTEETTPPLVAITSSGAVTNTPTQTVTGTVDVADAGTTVTVLDGVTPIGTAIVQGNGLWSTNVTLTGGGVHIVTAQDTDAAGNIGYSNSVVYTLNTALNPPPPAATTADMILRDSTTGNYEIYDIYSNTILAAYPLGQVGLEWQVAGLGGFYADDTSDMILRNSNNGAFELYDISNNNITGATSLGQVGTEWTVAGFGDFSGRANETDMLMRDDNTGVFLIYDISNNAVTSFTFPGSVGAEWTVAGFGNFRGHADETDMIMRNRSSGAFEVYDISNNAITSAVSMGAVGLNWQVVGFGDFSGNADETDMIMQNTGTGALEVYDISNNAVTSAVSMGAVGLNWQVVGFGDFSGNASETDMLMWNTSTGAFEVYDISNNALASAYSMGDVGMSWTVAGIAADPPIASSKSTAQFVQAMASMGMSAAANSAPVPALGAAEQSQQTLLTAPHA